MTQRPILRALRAAGMGVLGGAAFLFICRDLLQTSDTVYVAAAAVGIVFGIGLALLAPEAQSGGEPPAQS